MKPRVNKNIKYKVIKVKACHVFLRIKYRKSNKKNTNFYAALWYCKFPILKDASFRNIKKFRLSRFKNSIHWDLLDEDIDLISYIKEYENL